MNCMYQAMKILVECVAVQSGKVFSVCVHVYIELGCVPIV